MTAVRPAQADDYARVLGWVSDAAAMYQFAGPSLTWPPQPEQLGDIGRRPGLSAWMVHDGDAQVPWGHFDLTVQGSSARLGRVIVDPRRRGGGRGHTLVQAVIEKARGLGADEVRLAVIADNAPAVATYRRAGFAEIEDPERPQFLAMIHRL